MILPATETRTTHAKATQAVDILAFVKAQEISSVYFETPYYLAPAPGDEKAYALLRETLQRTGQVGIAYVVIHARQHLAAVIPYGQGLLLNTLRWSSEERANDELALSDNRLTLDWRLRDAAPTAAGATGTLAYRDAFHADVTALHELEDDDQMDTGLLYPDGLQDDDPFGIDDCLARVLQPRPHPPDGGRQRREYAVRARPRRPQIRR